MTNFNLPPGVSVESIPGNRPEDQAWEKLWLEWEEVFGELPKLLSTIAIAWAHLISKGPAVEEKDLRKAQVLCEGIVKSMGDAIELRPTEDDVEELLNKVTTWESNTQDSM